MRQIIAASILVLCARVNAADWARVVGGPAWDGPSSIAISSDGGCIVANNTTSFGGGAEYTGNALVTRFNAAGKLLWTRVYGAYYDDTASAIITRSAGGFVLAGSTESQGAGLEDAWVFRLDPAGRVVWQKAIGGERRDWFSAITETSDGGLLAVGGSYSYSGASADFLVVRLSASGDVQWMRTFGGSRYDAATTVDLAADGGFLVAGYTESFSYGALAAWILKLDSAGNIRRQSVYGGSTSEIPSHIHSTRDGGFIMVCNGDHDTVVLKGTGNGAIEWQRRYRTGATWDSFTRIEQDDSGYILCGYIWFGGSEDYGLLLQIADDGDIIRQLGIGTDMDYPHLAVTTSGWCYAAGTTRALDSDGDIKVMRFDLGTHDVCRTVSTVQFVTVNADQAWRSSTSCKIGKPKLQVTRTSFGTVNVQPIRWATCH